MLESLKKSLDAPVPEAFPQSAQYKKNFRAVPADQDPDEEEAEVPNKRKKPKTKKQKKAKGPAQAKFASKSSPKAVVGAADSEEYAPKRYAELRKKFMDDLRAEGVAYKMAASQWDSSALKKQLLAPLDLPELKRRRFVTKDCTENPWAN